MNTTSTGTRLSAQQRQLLAVVACYDNEIRFDTRDGNERRTLRSLARLGLVEVSDDATEDGRLYAWPAEEA